MMHTEGETWVCRSCENEVQRDSQAEAAMTTRDRQQDGEVPAVADATQDSSETMEEWPVRPKTVTATGPPPR
jgi:DNA-directed RNA polymerase subunit M